MLGMPAVDENELEEKKIEKERQGGSSLADELGDMA
jgi:hypothetical protein